MYLVSLENDGRLIFAGANPAADKLMHMDNSRLVGLPMEQAFPGLTGTEAPERFRVVCAQNAVWHAEQFEYRDQDIAGSFELHCFQVEPGLCACMFQDRSERKVMETRLRHLTQQDPLTGIANRTMCLERIGIPAKAGNLVLRAPLGVGIGSIDVVELRRTRSNRQPLARRHSLCGRNILGRRSLAQDRQRVVARVPIDGVIEELLRGTPVERGPRFGPPAFPIHGIVGMTGNVGIKLPDVLFTPK